MNKPRTRPTMLIPMLLLPVVAATTAGCNEGDRVARMAESAASRQAEQNREMAQLNREVADSHKRLVEADAEARREVLAMERDLVRRDAEGRRQLGQLQRETQAAACQQRTSLDRQQEELEAERREIAGQRGRDPIIAAAITALGLLVACLLPLVLAIQLLRAVHENGPSETELAELLTRELLGERSMLQSPLDWPARPVTEDRGAGRLALESGPSQPPDLPAAEGNDPADQTSCP